MECAQHHPATLLSALQSLLPLALLIEPRSAIIEYAQCAKNSTGDKQIMRMRRGKGTAQEIAAGNGTWTEGCLQMRVDESGRNERGSFLAPAPALAGRTIDMPDTSTKSAKSEKKDKGEDKKSEKPLEKVEKAADKVLSKADEKKLEKPVEKKAETSEKKLEKVEKIAENKAPKKEEKKAEKTEKVVEMKTEKTEKVAEKTLPKAEAKKVESKGPKDEKKDSKEQLEVVESAREVTSTRTGSQKTDNVIPLSSKSATSVKEKGKKKEKKRRSKPPARMGCSYPGFFEQTRYNIYTWLDMHLYPCRPLYFASATAAVALSRRPILAHLLPNTGSRVIELLKLVSCSALTIYLPVLATRFLLKHTYFSYKGWLFEKKPSWKSKLWGAVGKALSFVPPRRLSCDLLLPTLPLPALADSVNGYVTSLKHILSPEDWDELQLVADDFINSEGAKLQRYARMWWLMNENYVTPFWEKYIYLNAKYPTIMNSNVGCVGLLEKPAATRAYRMARLLHITAQLQLANYKGEAPAPGSGLVCARHYDWMFAMNRIPSEDCDWKETSGVSRHMVVLARGGIYRVELFDEHDRPMSVAQLTKMLEHVERQPAVQGPEGQIAALTTDTRDQWARNRRRFFTQDAHNSKALAVIEGALAAAVFDEEEYDVHESAAYNRYLHAMLCGKGGDRWCDKRFNVVVAANGRCGINTEHSGADGAEFSHILEDIELLDMGCLPAYPPLKEQQTLALTPHEQKMIMWPQQVDIRCNAEMLAEINRCLVSHRKAAGDIEVHGLMFTVYGKGKMKQFGCSPDAYLQMAFQLAAYKDQEKLLLTYEPASARFFANSRTETLRTVCDQSASFVQVMNSELTSKREKVRALRKACSTHALRNREIITGQGLDRHLFVLVVLSKALGVTSPFLEHYQNSKWLLCTSHSPSMSKGLDEDDFPQDSWLGAVFSPVAADGYGVSYRLGGNHSIYINVTAFKSSEKTDAARFAGHIEESLREIADIFTASAENDEAPAVLPSFTTVSRSTTDVSILDKKEPSA